MLRGRLTACFQSTFGSSFTTHPVIVFTLTVINDWSQIHQRVLAFCIRHLLSLMDQGSVMTDPRSNSRVWFPIGRIRLRCYPRPLDQGSGEVVCVSLALILLAFVGASPQNIYSFVSAINIQMRLNIIYNPWQSFCQVLISNHAK